MFYRFYIFLRYCPPTSNMAAVSCPRLQYLVASIKTSNMFTSRMLTLQALLAHGTK